MRALIGTALLVLAYGTATAADDPIDPKKLIGEWDQPGDAKKKVPQNAIEFETDGRARFKVAPNADSEFNSVTEFNYEVKGRAVVLSKMTRDGDLVRTFRVTKFVDDVLEATEEGSGVKYSFKRVKSPAPPKPDDKK
ncbi:hypothetical protein [Gemmata sp.]|uniref:hypothetical protein n=1 Tax=Gemmata sp. TaxID=1914242 RepID=UPI003F7172E7